ncbi:MAG: ABC transporter permease, partial [Clostridiales bacterium]|nr:ABC transporter permease [Clostridiales bacterium]
MQDVFSKLRRANRKNYTLYLVCTFVAMMLITAFSAMIFSPTVRTIFPEGGDSLKQVYAIFALACTGSVVFTIYADAPPP